MRDEPGDLPVDVVGDEVRTGWGLPADTVRYLPVGAGSYNWVVDADGRPRWFVKGDRIGDGGERIHATFRTAAALRGAGLDFVLAPAPDLAGDLLRQIAPGWALSVWPYVDAPAAGDGPWPNAGDLEAIACLLGRLHSAVVPASTPNWSPADDILTGAIDAFVPGLATSWTGGPFGETGRRLLIDAASMIDRLAARYVELVRQLDRDDAPWVVTHGEPHSANVLVTASDRWLLIDWDSVRIAPRERDFRVIDPSETVLAAYATTAGPVELRPDVRELFRVEWDLDEIGWFASCLRRPHVASADAHRALESLRMYVDVGNRWPALA